MITVSWEEVKAMVKAPVHNLEEILEFHKNYLSEENEDGDTKEIQKEG